jgi:ribonuclease P protein component
MLPLQNRLKNKNDFSKVFSVGQYASKDGLAIKYLKTNLPETRIGFSVGKSYSKKAVDRNSARRKMRAVVSKELSRIKPGFDIILFIQPHKKTLSFSESLLAISALLKKSDLLRP